MRDIVVCEGNVSGALKQWVGDNYGMLLDRVRQSLGDVYTPGGVLSVYLDGRGKLLDVFYGDSESESEEVCTYDIVSSVRGDVEKHPLRFMSESSLNTLAREVLPEGDLNELSCVAAEYLVKNVPVAFALDSVRGFACEVLPGERYDNLLRAAVFNVIRDSSYLVEKDGPVRGVAEDVLYQDELRLILDSIGRM